MRRLPFLSALVVLGLGIALTLVTATQYALHSAGAGLDLALAPWASWRWVPRGFDSDPALLTRWSLIHAGGLALSFLACALVFIQLRRNRPVADMHGTARWANAKEIKASGLLGNEGVFVGGIKDHYLRHDGPEHVLVAAPTRSGKGVSLVIPTLLTWPHSVFTVDIKGELWALTRPWREEIAKQRCVRLDFANEDSAAFNPLDAVRVGTAREIGDIQNLVTLLVDPEGKGLDGRDGHWKKAAHALLTGLIAFALHQEERASLGGVAQLLNPSDRTFADVLNEMQAWSGRDTAVTALVNAAARQHMARQGEEAASVLSTTANYLVLYRDPLIARNTDHSDFEIKQLVDGDRPMSLYLVISPADKARVQGLTRLVISLITRRLTDELAFTDGRAHSAHQRRLLLLLDEFPALGRLDVITDTIAYMASYGIKAMLVIQDFSQLWATYGKDESITANCHVRTAFAPNTIETAKRLSEMSGTTTQLKHERRTGGKVNMVAAAEDRWQEVSRPLMTPDEVMRLPGPQKHGEQITAPGEMLIFIAGRHPIRGVQPLYFENEALLARAHLSRDREGDSQ